jgi:hypothetical protein
MFSLSLLALLMTARLDIGSDNWSLHDQVWVESEDRPRKKHREHPEEAIEQSHALHVRRLEERVDDEEKVPKKALDKVVG